MKSVTMHADGRLTVPASARRALGIQGETQFQVEVSDGVLVLRSASAIPGEDAWAYTEKHRRQVKQALREEAEGQILRLKARDLERLVE